MAESKTKNSKQFKIFLNEYDDKNEVIGGMELFAYVPVYSSGESAVYTDAIKGYLNYKVKDSEGNLRSINEEDDGIRVTIFPSFHKNLPTKVYEEQYSKEDGKRQSIEILRMFHKSFKPGDAKKKVEATYVPAEASKSFRELKEEKLDMFESIGGERKMYRLAIDMPEDFKEYKDAEKSLWANGEKMKGSVPDNPDFFGMNLSKYAEFIAFNVGAYTDKNGKIKIGNPADPKVMDSEEFLKIKLKEKLNSFIKASVSEYENDLFFAKTTVFNDDGKVKRDSQGRVVKLSLSKEERLNVRTVVKKEVRSRIINDVQDFKEDMRIGKDNSKIPSLNLEDLRELINKNTERVKVAENQSSQQMSC